MMKLYDVPRGTRIVVRDEEGNALRLTFHHLDGMFSYCEDDHGNVVHVAAAAEVELDK